MPSPAFSTGICSRRATKSGAPDAACRITIASGFIASSVHTVSISDSPFFKLDDSACKFIVSAPSRDAAVPKLMRVRVDASKNASATVLPRKRRQFFQGVPLEFLEWLRLVEDGCDLLGRQWLDAEQMVQARGHSDSRTAERGRRSFDAVHEHHTLLVVDFLQTYFDDFGVAGGYRAAYERRFNRQLAMPAVDQDAHPHAPWPA